MRSSHLVDPDLLPILKSMPEAEVTRESLPLMRSRMQTMRLAAPPVEKIEEREVRVARQDGSDIRVLLYTSTAKPCSGALLWFHGGGMVRGFPRMNELQNRYIAAQAGCLVAAVEYRLAPEFPFPHGLDDGYRALRWLHEHAHELGIPEERVAVAGESGGGALAAGISLLARDRGDYPISAQFLLCPMLDDRTGTVADPSPMPFAGEIGWTREKNAFSWCAVLGDKATSKDVSAYAAPGRAEDLAGLPRTFLSVGDIDLFVGESLRFASGLIRDGVPTELHIHPGAAHGLTAWAPNVALSKAVQGEFWAAMQEHFTRERKAV